MVRLRLTQELVLPWAPDPFLIGIPNRILQGKGIFCFNSNNGLPRNERNLRISERTNLRIITLSNPYSLLFVWMKNKFRGEGEKPIPLQRKERNETKWNGKTRWGCQLKVVELPSLSYLCVINWKPFLFFEFPYLLYLIEELVQAYFFLSFGFSKSIKEDEDCFPSACFLPWLGKSDTLLLWVLHYGMLRDLISSWNIVLWYANTCLKYLLRFPANGYDYGYGS